MARTIQKFLHKYHKQSLIKKPFLRDAQSKENFVNQHGLVFKVQDEMDAILLDVYHVSTQNKEALQQAIETTRNNVFDMWEHLTNLQKNHLLQVENQALYDALPHFYYNDQKIYIAFFNELLNSLIDKRPDVFELEQFFKLYKNYLDEIIPVSDYGHLPFASDFSVCELLRVDQDVMFLYHPTVNVVYEIENFNIKRRFPFALKQAPSLAALQDFASLVTYDKLDAIKAWLTSQNVLSLKAQKATLKKAFKKIEEV
ncbi:MAG: hypothetical protein GX845_03110 [Erysipelothrix sp.]|jgi:hypothetical protein|nr:hypothetical protein [Erysipelothrix sp.]